LVYAEGAGAGLLSGFSNQNSVVREPVPGPAHLSTIACDHGRSTDRQDLSLKIHFDRELASPIRRTYM